MCFQWQNHVNKDQIHVWYNAHPINKWTNWFKLRILRTHLVRLVLYIMVMITGRYIPLFLILQAVTSEELLSTEFGISPGRYFKTERALSKEIYHTLSDCAILCLQTKCCLTVSVRKQIDGSYICQTLDTHVASFELTEDANAIFLFRKWKSGM